MLCTFDNCESRLVFYHIFGVVQKIFEMLDLNQTFVNIEKLVDTLLNLINSDFIRNTYIRIAEMQIYIQ